MTPTTELPDEIYVCERPSEISARFSTLEVCRDETGMGGWPAKPYTRKDKADAEIARLRAAVRDLDSNLRTFYKTTPSQEKHADTIRECME